MQASSLYRLPLMHYRYTGHTLDFSQCFVNSNLKLVESSQGLVYLGWRRTIVWSGRARAGNWSLATPSSRFRGRTSAARQRSVWPVIWSSSPRTDVMRLRKLSLG
jgi:hypothetical protein